jgi:threonine/homoserine/homoserine lactone efflux protein
LSSYPIFQGLFAGLVLGLSLAAPPGPINATMAQRVSLRKTWIAGFAVGLGAMTTDGIYLAITYLGWADVISVIKGAIGWVYLVGGCVMMLFAALMVVQYRRRSRNTNDEKIQVKTRGAHFSYILGLSMGISNPFSIAWWLSVGLASISSFGPVVVVGFFAGITIWLAIFNAVLKLGSLRFENFELIALYVSAAVLFSFGLYFLYGAIKIF